MKNILYPILILIISCLSCNTDDCVQGDGSSIIENRDVGLYSVLSNNTIVDVVISDSVVSQNMIELLGEQNIINQITTSVNGSNLVIDNNSNCLSTTGTTLLRLFQSDLNEINNSGTGEISGILSSENLMIINGGTGDIDLSGLPHNSLNITNDGTGDIKVDLIEAQNVVVENSGTGDIYLNAIASLSGNISGTGDIYYKGNPIINIVTTGTGEVIDNN